MDVTISGAGATAAAPRVRRLDSADIGWALREGWADFREKRGDLLLVPLVYAGVGLAAALFTLKGDLWPLLFPAAAGFALVGPLAAAGFYELARRREEGREAGWWHFLDPLKGPARLPMLALSVMLATLFLAWLAAAQLIYAGTLGRLHPGGPGEFLALALTTREGWTMGLVGNLVGAGFACLTLALAAFSFPMVVDRAGRPGNSATTAVATSLAVFRRNPAVALRWGVTVALVLLLGSLPLFVGLVVALPVLGYATWHLYTRAVER